MNTNLDGSLGFAILAAAVRIAAASIFMIGALHKRKLGAEFEGIVAGYRVLPRLLVAPLARALPWLEMTAVILLLWPSAALIAVLPALALLLTMTAALSLNLARGRTWIDCGCGGTLGQGLSWSMVLRNSVLMVLLIAAARPLDLATLGIGGSLLSLVVAAALTVFFFSSSQLSANARQWRLVRGDDRA